MPPIARPSSLLVESERLISVGAWFDSMVGHQINCEDNMSALGIICVILGFVSCILLMTFYSISIANILTSYSVSKDIKNWYSKSVDKSTDKNWSTKR